MRWIVVLALAGCHAAHPTAYIDGGASGVGEPVYVTARWDATCQRLHLLAALAIKGREAIEPETCHEQTFRISVECSRRCIVVGNGVTTFGRATLPVYPLEPGAFEMTATVTNLGDGTTQTMALQPMTIYWPRDVELSCWRDGKSRPCGPDGVPAAAPFVTPAPASIAMQVNGVPAPRNDGQPISLAELFPDARAGARGVVPGTYTITLADGPVTSTWQVVAR